MTTTNATTRFGAAATRYADRIKLRVRAIAQIRYSTDQLVHQKANRRRLRNDVTIMLLSIPRVRRRPCGETSSQTVTSVAYIVRGCAGWAHLLNWTRSDPRWNS